MSKRITRLERELALALDLAARLNIEPASSPIETGTSRAWGNPSLFQEKINVLLAEAGRQPTPTPATTKQEPAHADS